MDDFKLHRLHPCGKVLIGFFAVMVMVAMIWMALVGMMESGMIGEAASTITQEGWSWSHFKANMEWSLAHLSTQALLYLAVGLLFMMTTYSHKLKKFFFWLLGILIGLHVLGIAGYGFCWPGNLFTYVPGPIIIVLFFIMSLMILINLGKKSSTG
jgi:hypothetical protein